MSAPGKADLLFASRAALLDALEALVDLMVPEALAGARGGRGGRASPRTLATRRGAQPASRPRSSITRPSLCVHSNRMTTARSR